MSIVNNRDTLEHYLGKVWLTRPRPSTQDQEINVCVLEGEEYYALGRITLHPDGTYGRNEEPIGRREDKAFQEYIGKLTGTQGMSESDLYDAVCAGYDTHGSVGATAKNLSMSRERVRRILITRGKLTSELISNIAWLYDGGKGKTVSEIAEMLRVSESVVQKNMGYAGGC